MEIVNESNAAKYAANKQKSDMLDGIIEKYWNRKTKLIFYKGGRTANEAYADKYASTVDRLRAKLEARKKE